MSSAPKIHVSVVRSTPVHQTQKRPVKGRFRICGSCQLVRRSVFVLETRFARLIFDCVVELLVQ